MRSRQSWGRQRDCVWSEAIAVVRTRHLLRYSRGTYRTRLRGGSQLGSCQTSRSEGAVDYERMRRRGRGEGTSHHHLSCQVCFSFFCSSEISREADSLSISESESMETVV